MCILFIYRNPDANAGSYRLIIASNRDEMYKRPALSAHYWGQHPECLGGIDMEAGKEGGTWLALSTRGKAAVILNYVGKEAVMDASKKNRGFLIRDFITSSDSIELYLDKLHKENVNRQPYNPYCLVLLDLNNANVHYLNNCVESIGPIICNSDIIGIGNGGIDHSYKKVEAGKEEFKLIIKNAHTSNENNLIEELINFLKSKERHLPDPELQERYPTKYKVLSSIFVSVEKQYGTRTHSILLIDGSNNITFIEETLMSDFTWKRQQFKNNLMRQ
ncbi:transport and Golgi organization protein 2 homolog isoform X1 [Odontomachus brunneus]|nr:transport and Golgi organization protein 2 homolog isoform X1 [Odontomachus brunneus]